MTDTEKERNGIGVQFLGLNIVLAANELNLSIFKPVWMCQYGILKPEEISEIAFITPAAIQIPNEDFHLTILPNRLQLGLPTPKRIENSKLIDRIIGGILKALPHTPFAAMGINIDILVHPKNPTEFKDWNNQKFASPIAKLVCLDEGSPRFGSYFSIFVNDARLKVDVKPIRVTEDAPTPDHPIDPKFEYMKFNFNYHIDLDPENPVVQAFSQLNKAMHYLDHAESVIEKLIGE